MVENFTQQLGGTKDAARRFALWMRHRGIDARVARDDGFYDLLTKYEADAEVMAADGFKPVTEMTRDELIAGLMWNTGGNSYGLCEVASMALQTMKSPSAERPDWKLVVIISVTEAAYTDEELRLLYLFSIEQTVQYDRIFQYRTGANMICISKFDADTWSRKRQSWDMGPMESATLEDALDTFRNAPRAEWKKLWLDRMSENDEEGAFQAYFEYRLTCFTRVRPDESEIRQEYKTSRTIKQLRYFLKNCGWKTRSRVQRLAQA